MTQEATLREEKGMPTEPIRERTAPAKAAMMCTPTAGRVSSFVACACTTQTSVGPSSHRANARPRGAANAIDASAPIKQ